MKALNRRRVPLFAWGFCSTFDSEYGALPSQLRAAGWMPLALWIDSELGWLAAEYGRQPSAIYDVLPAHRSVSMLSVNSLYGSRYVAACTWRTAPRV